MSSQQPTTAGRPTVPSSFEQFVASIGGREIEQSTRCTACLQPGGRWEIAGSVYCRVCLADMHGFDRGEALMVTAIIAGAVTAALDHGASPQLVRQAVEHALADREDSRPPDDHGEAQR